MAVGYQLLAARIVNGRVYFNLYNLGCGNENPVAQKSFRRRRATKKSTEANYTYNHTRPNS